MVQKKDTTNKKKSSVKKTSASSKATTATSKETTRPLTSRAVQIVEPNPLPVVLKNDHKEKQTPARITLTILLFILTATIWFLVGQKAFYIITEEIWLRNQRAMRVAPITNDVVATVNGEVIRLFDVRDFAKAIPQLAELPFEVIYPQLLETMIDSKVLLAAAEANGTDKLPNVEKAIKLSREQIVSQAYLEKRLAESVTSEQLQALYDQEAENFKPVEEIRARHILVKTKKEAQDIIVKLHAGADFGKLADRYSLDKGSKKGELGYFKEDQMIPEFGRAVFELKVGQVSDPIKTPFGYHIVEVEDSRLSQMPAFEDVEDQLRQLAMEQNLRSVMEDERQKMNVQIKKPRI